MQKNVRVRRDVPTLSEIKNKMRNEVPFEYEERDDEDEEYEVEMDAPRGATSNARSLSQNKSSVVKVFIIVVIAFIVLIAGIIFANTRKQIDIDLINAIDYRSTLYKAGVEYASGITVTQKKLDSLMKLQEDNNLKMDKIDATIKKIIDKKIVDGK